MAKLSIVIPVYNEAPTVRQLLHQVWNAPITVESRELIIIESNSNDGTREIVQSFAQEKNSLEPGSVRLILQEKALGKGYAVRQGFTVATGDIILIQDGDLEYSVEDYPALLAPLLAGHTKFVLGSRHLASGNWRIRTFDKSPIRSSVMNFGGILFHTIFNLVYGQKLTDPTTMYKVFERKCLNGLNFESNRFEFDFELVAKLVRAGFTPYEVPITYHSRGFEEGKKVRMFADPIRWIWAILKFRIKSIYA